MSTGTPAISDRTKVERRARRQAGQRADQITSYSGACEWLLMQYEEIDRKFSILEDPAQGEKLRRGGRLKTSSPR